MNLQARWPKTHIFPTPAWWECQPRAIAPTLATSFYSPLLLVPAKAGLFVSGRVEKCSKTWRTKKSNFHQSFHVFSQKTRPFAKTWTMPRLTLSSSNRHLQNMPEVEHLATSCASGDPRRMLNLLRKKAG